MSSRTKALLAIILASVLWSTAGLAKIIVRELDPYIAAFLRFFVASLVILPLFLKENINRKHLFLDLVPLSLLSSANILFYYIGLSTSTANAATLIYAGVPLVTAVIAHQWIGERMNVQKLIGILLGLVGVLFIALLPSITKGGSVTGTLTGNIFFVLAVLVWSLYTIGSRQAIAKKGYSPLTVSSISIFTTTIFFLCVSLFTFKSDHIPILTHPSTILIVLQLGIFATVATYLLFQYAVKHSSASTAVLGNYIGPVFSILVNVIVLGEIVTPSFLFGTALILVGVVVISGSGLLQEAKDWVNR
jgi:drug/metabolite transporter (DMT)-like permease